MPPHVIDADRIEKVEWNTFCRPAVRLELSDGDFDIVTRECALALVRMGVVAAPMPDTP